MGKLLNRKRLSPICFIKVLLTERNVENDNDIFVWIEKKMNVVVPPYLKSILKSCGYDNCYAIATIVNADLDYFTDEMKKGNIEFSRGHSRLLEAIVKIVKGTLETGGCGSFSLVPSKVSPSTVPIIHEKQEPSSSKALSVYRKRFKPSEHTQVNNNDIDQDDDISVEGQARNTLIRKAVTILITHTPKLFAKVSAFFSKYKF